ncbi:hypothetical protein DFP72DRAFT_923180, partial [Ephemerocybe angulata]
MASFERRVKAGEGVGGPADVFGDAYNSHESVGSVGVNVAGLGAGGKGGVMKSAEGARAFARAYVDGVKGSSTPIASNSNVNNNNTNFFAYSSSLGSVASRPFILHPDEDREREREREQPSPTGSDDSVSMYSQMSVNLSRAGTAASNYASLGRGGRGSLRLGGGGSLRRKGTGVMGVLAEREDEAGFEERGEGEGDPPSPSASELWPEMGEGEVPYAESPVIVSASSQFTSSFPYTATSPRVTPSTSTTTITPSSAGVAVSMSPSTSLGTQQNVNGEGASGLVRMDTVAIGNLIKSRAAARGAGHSAQPSRQGSGFSDLSRSSTVIIKDVREMYESGRDGEGLLSPVAAKKVQEVVAGKDGDENGEGEGEEGKDGGRIERTRTRTQSGGARGRLVPTAQAVQRARSLSRGPDSPRSPITASAPAALATPPQSPGKPVLGRSPSSGGGKWKPKAWVAARKRTLSATSAATTVV